MKLYRDYKKLYKYFIFGFIILFVFQAQIISAITASDLNQKINQKNSDIERLEKEIKKYQEELESLNKQKDSLNVALKKLDLTKKKLTTDISVTENKITKTNLRIEELSLDISDKKNSIYTFSDVVSKQLRYINEQDLNSITESLLAENDLSTVWKDIDNISSINEKIRQDIIELRKIKSDLESKKKATEEAKRELLSLKKQLADEKKIVEQNALEKKKLLSQTKNNESNYQKLLKDRLAKKDAFEKELRDYESQLKYILDPSKLPDGGILSWPLDYIYITQKFGKTEAGKRLYANGTHNGADFRASVGTPVKAMSDGIVAGVGDTDIQCPGVSFGKFVLLKYDIGLSSTLGHLSLIKVKNGDKVSKGQIVGYSGNTGYSTGPHLHVSLYPRDAVEVKTLPSKSCPGRVLTQPIAPINAYLDPLYYLPKLN